MEEGLVTVDEARFLDAIEIYFLWKELDRRIRSSSTRGVNFPETISEALACYTLGFQLKKNGSGDAVNGDEIVEFKATSNWESDLSSFSPSEEFDRLYFLRLDKKTDELHIYDTRMNSDDVKKIKVSKGETFAEQQADGRRPRFSIIDSIIKAKGLQAIAKVDIKGKKVIKL